MSKVKVTTLRPIQGYPNRYSVALLPSHIAKALIAIKRARPYQEGDENLTPQHIDESELNHGSKDQEVLKPKVNVAENQETEQNKISEPEQPAPEAPQSFLMSAAVKKMIEDAHINPADIIATGAGGRILKADVEKHLSK